LKIKAFTEMPIKIANLKIVMNQIVTRAIRFVARVAKNEATCAVQQNFCA
jgi:hypothetical protein